MAITFKIKVGQVVRHVGERYIVVEIKNLSEVLCRNLATQETVLTPIHELAPDESQNLIGKKVSVKTDLATIPSEQWAEASKRLELIRSLDQKGRYKRSQIEIHAIANILDRSPQTVYRWLKKYEQDGSISAFLPKERTDKGCGRLDEAVEEIIHEAIRRLLLKREFGTIKDVHRDVKRACTERNLKAPGMTVIRDRFLQISEKERVASRQGAKVACEKFTPLRGSFPGANHPLDVIQIDHTPADLIIVDDIYRKPIGRPTITIAIDVFSRVVMGFNMWLEAPGGASLGMCMLHALLPKEKWLADRGLKAEWPCYGRPRKIHTDNAKEFRGTVFGRACKSYGIDLEQRPKGQPHFGGHVERGFRTYLRKIHTVEGTTFSNTRSKFEYDAEGKAILSLKEFEFWFATYIAKVYHHDGHGGIKMTPMAQFTEGILGGDGRPGIGAPERFTDEERVRLDFLPFVERTVQEYGVLIDHIYYNDDILRSRIHEKDPDNPKSARKFLFRRDPTDVSVIYFWDPNLKTYREIPTAHRGRPPVSLWEIRSAVRELNAKGKATVNENMIYEGIDEMREIERSAAERTKSARRNEQRRLESEKRRKKLVKAKPKLHFPSQTSETSQLPRATPTPVATDQSPARPAVSSLLNDDEVILPFDDIDVRS